eukprot:scaffold104252_cov61-Phaeocystis_antarctica.AAC.6
MCAALTSLEGPLAGRPLGCSCSRATSLSSSPICVVMATLVCSSALRCELRRSCACCLSSCALVSASLRNASASSAPHSRSSCSMPA